jgi:hypothetical protein
MELGEGLMRWSRGAMWSMGAVSKAMRCSTNEKSEDLDIPFFPAEHWAYIPLE